MRTASTALKNHLDDECTTICTLWRITRDDGIKFYFTDLDQDVVFDGNTYQAEQGYNRTAVASSESFGIDNLDLTGFFDTANGLVEQEVRDGLFDFAEVIISVVNYEDLTQGEMILRRGFLGEVKITPSGFFVAELRGMVQKMTRVIGNKFSAECRADLGDKRCKIPLNPPVVQRETVYAAGEWVRDQVNAGSSVSYTAAMTNLDFETASLSGWTVTDGSPINSSSIEGLGPYEGSFLAGGGTSSSFAMYQDKDLTTIGSFDTAAVDAGEVVMNASIRRASTGVSQKDTGRVRIEAKNAAGAVISDIWDTGHTIIRPDDTWVLQSIEDKVLPVGTRSIRVWLEGIRYDSSGELSAVFDNLAIEFTDTNGATGIQEMYGNKIYEVTVGGTTASTLVAYTTTNGNTTVDGSVTVKCYEAWARHAEVLSVTDNRVFVPIIDEVRAIPGWFTGGFIVWETGNNAGDVMEIKDWSASAITLFIAMDDDIQVGDKMTIYVGCDKSLNTCTNKFAMTDSIDFDEGNFLNFRGEPYLPGRDAIARYPDSK